MTISIYSISRRKSTPSTSLKIKISWEKLRLIGLKRASGRALDP